MTNFARFTINGTPSETASGDRGYDASDSEALTITLETNPAGSVISVKYELPDSTNEKAPFASLDAPELTFDGSGTATEILTAVNDPVTLSAGEAGHAWVIRATVTTSNGTQTFERLIVTRKNTIRKTVPAETSQYSARGWSDAINEAVSAIGQAGAGLPGGADTQMQFNNDGELGGIPSFTWNGSNLKYSGEIASADDKLLSRASWNNRQRWRAGINDGSTATGTVVFTQDNSVLEVTWKIRIGDAVCDYSAYYKRDGAGVISVLSEYAIYPVPPGYSIAAAPATQAEVVVTNNSGSLSPEIVIFSITSREDTTA